MKSKQLSNNVYCLKIEKGEEVITTITKCCKQHNITSGYFTGIGGSNNVTIGIFNENTKKYKPHVIKQPLLEITSLVGNISTKGNEIYLHAHINVSDSSLNVKGGHLIQAMISITGEIFITKCNKKLVRQFDKQAGINLLKI
ncbi:MAG: DNA-binding protein [Mycoplasmataceae bacterium]|jgi:predicted DNA-binding protein with PD1-like motif|nr:DNA-binding protein [Mycoplasmataceae bacterium]